MFLNLAFLVRKYYVDILMKQQITHLLTLPLTLLLRFIFEKKTKEYICIPDIAIWRTWHRTTSISQYFTPGLVS